MKENNVITQQQTTDSIKKEDISFEVNVENENIIVTVPETEKKKFENIKVYIKPTNSLENPKVILATTNIGNFIYNEYLKRFDHKSIVLNSRKIKLT